MTTLNDLTCDSPRLVLLTGHCAPIDSLAFSPDGRTLISGSYDGAVILWDLPTQSMRARLGGHSSNIHLALSPDGTTLATVDFEAIRLWETATGRWLGTIPGYTGPLAFASPTELLAGVWGDDLVRLDSESGQVLDRFPLTAGDQLELTSTISPDGSTAVVAAYKSSVELLVWDLPTRSLKRRRRVPSRLVWKRRDPETGRLCVTHQVQADAGRLAVAPDNRLLAVGGIMAVWLCDLRTGRRKCLLQSGHDPTQSLAFSPSGKLLVGGTITGAVKVWAIPSGREVQSLAAHRFWTSAVAFSPDERTVASASHDKTIKLWDVANGQCRRRLPGREHEVLCVSFSPDERTIASGHEDGTVRQWDAITGELRHTLHCHSHWVNSLSFSRDGQSLACCSHDLFQQGRTGAVEFWDFRTGECLHRLELADSGFGPVTLFPQGPLLVVSRQWGMEEETRVWDWERGELRFQVEGRAAALSPDGSLVATARGWQGGISLWDTTTGALCREMDAPKVADGVVSLRFSPNGKTLLAGLSGYGMGLWSVATGEQLWEAGTHADTVTSLAFSPDGRTLAVGGAYQSEIVLWHLQPQLTEARTLIGHESNMRAASFHPDGRKLVTASADGTLKVWDAAEGRLLATSMILPTTDGSVSEEWITFTPTGHYVGSEGVDKYVNWQIGEKLLPAEPFRGEFWLPEVVARALR